MRLIDADALKAQIQKEIDRYYDDVGGGIHTAMEARDEIDLAPTVDALPIAIIEDLYNQAQEYRDQCEKHSQQWRVANDQMIGVGSVLLEWEVRKENETI